MIELQPIAHLKIKNAAKLRAKCDRMWSRMYRNDALVGQGRRCVYCMSPLSRKKATSEHKHPRSQGGLTKKENIAAACFDCNSAKGPLSEGAFLSLIRGREPPRNVQNLNPDDLGFASNLAPRAPRMRAH